VRETIPRLRLLAVVDTLEYAYRGGRIGKAKLVMGSLLKVKPIVQILNSELLPVENVRTMRKALRRLVELIRELGPLDHAAVIHARVPELAAELREMLADIHPIERIPISETGPVLATHAGPGAVGVGCVLSGS
jgi:DegV family protein with EDD domain